MEKTRKKRGRGTRQQQRHTTRTGLVRRDCVVPDQVLFTKSPSKGWLSAVIIIACCPGGVKLNKGYLTHWKYLGFKISLWQCWDGIGTSLATNANWVEISASWCHLTKSRLRDADAAAGNMWDKAILGHPEYIRKKVETCGGLT